MFDSLLSNVLNLLLTLIETISQLSLKPVANRRVGYE